MNYFNKLNFLFLLHRIFSLISLYVFLCFVFLEDLVEWLWRTTVNRIGNCRWFESNSLHMFDMLTKFLKTYTVWGQYLQEKHYRFFYIVVIISCVIFILLNIAMYI
jgi:hypothetical protein